MGVLDLFANAALTTLAGTAQPWAAAPAPGTVETWQVVSSGLPLPQPVAGVSQYRAAISPLSPPDTQPEYVMVGQPPDASHVSVTRGIEGSPVKAHALGDLLVCVLTLGGLQVFPLTHLTGTGTAATIAAGGALGNAPGVPGPVIAGNDVRGEVKFTTGGNPTAYRPSATGAATPTMATVTFAVPHPVPPTLSFEPLNEATADAIPVPLNVTVNGFDIGLRFPQPNILIDLLYQVIS
jgi:hypothetical protein